MIDRLKYIALAGAIGVVFGGLVAAAVRSPAEPFPSVIVVGFVVGMAFLPRPQRKTR